MKILILTNEQRVRKFYDLNTLPKDIYLTFADIQDSDEDILKFGTDYDVILCDAIQKVSERVINAMPNLKLIHSEGVAYNAIDVKAASKRNVFVCHCNAINDTAVAEETVLLILAILKRLREGEYYLYAGRQMETKTRFIAEGLLELNSQKVGIYGLGAIGKATAKLLNAFGADVYYYKRHRLSHDEEQKLNITYLDKSEIFAYCDIISLHCPVTDETKNLINEETLKLFKPTAILINTARGELINQDDLYNALVNDKIAAFGADVLTPEPVQADNILLNLPQEHKYKTVLTPHIGGVTLQTFYKGHKQIWDNILAIYNCAEPKHSVN